MKWICIAIIALFGSLGLCGAMSDYRKSIETKAAMENGYEQVVEGRTMLWKKNKELK